MNTLKNIYTNKKIQNKPTPKLELNHGNLWEILEPKWVFCFFVGY